MQTLTKSAALLILLLLPTRALAQASVTGTVRDASGAVLPGVTVEASSPALIEKTRTATTDGSGQYRITSLRPGTYVLMFTLPGFAPVKRENVELAGTQTLTIPIEMRVGGIEESITVAGESPVVDVQQAKREVVMSNDTIAALPLTRAAGSLLNATPGLFVDTNGPALSPTMTFFNARSAGSNSTSVAGEGRMTVNGMTVAAARSGGVSSYVYDTPNAQEVAITVGGGLGESDIGGPVMNLVPKSGGNTFAGQVFFNDAGKWSKGNNLDDELRAIGLTETPGIIQAYDASASYGGPIKRDRLWFFGSYRNLDTQNAMEGINANANAGDPSRWDWIGSPIPARLVQDRQMIIGRVTGQVGRSRLSFNSEYQHRCEGTPLKVDTSGCHNRGNDWIGLGNNQAPFQSPEATSTAARGYFDVPFYLNQPSWTMAVNNKLLIEAGYTAFRYNPIFGHPPPDGITNLIAVNEQSNAINPATGQRYAPQPNFLYRGVESWGWAVGQTDGWQAMASYVTGAHNMKVGYQGNRLDQLDETISNQPQLSYRFNQGVAECSELPAARLRPPDFTKPGRHLHSGQLHARQADAAGRAAVRSRIELRARRTERHHGDVVPESGADHHFEDGRRRCLQRSHSTRRRCLRPVRQRQNGPQVQLGPLPRVRRERCTVHVDQSRFHRRAGSPKPQLDRLEPQLRRRLRPDERCLAGQVGQRRRHLCRRDRQSRQLRQGGRGDDRQSSGVARLGSAAERLSDDRHGPARNHPAAFR
jgi:hypothetical protein